MKRIRDIIRADFITMNGAKNEVKSLAVIMFLMITAAVLFLSPLAGIYFPFLFSAFFIQLIFKNEMKYNCEKMYSVLPINRNDLVNARYLYCSILYFSGNLLFYLLTVLSQKMQFCLKIHDGNEEMDIIQMIVKMNGGKLSAVQLLSLIYTVAFCISLKLTTVQLIRYFKAGAKKTNDQMKMMNGMKHLSKKEKRESILSAVFILTLLLLFFGLLTGVISIGPTATVIFMLIGRLAELADGLLLNLILLMIAIMQMVYAYFRTLIVYGKREL